MLCRQLHAAERPSVIPPRIRVITHAYIEFLGERFSPEAAEQATGLVLLEKREPGHIGRRGRYRDIGKGYKKLLQNIPNISPKYAVGV